jgi:hypothetical protein
MRARVGVTGHRRLADPARLAAEVDRVLDGWEGGVIVSALAEGADRLVAARALERDGWRLEAVLPMPVADFLEDFDTEASRDEFRALLARADSVSVVDAQPSRVDAYAAAGVELVDGVDVLVAVWDGQPSRGRGGTADVVAYARELGRPLEWIRAEAPA